MWIIQANCSLCTRKIQIHGSCIQCGWVTVRLNLASNCEFLTVHAFALLRGSCVQNTLHVNYHVNLLILTMIHSSSNYAMPSKKLHDQ